MKLPPSARALIGSGRLAPLATIGRRPVSAGPPARDLAAVVDAAVAGTLTGAPDLADGVRLGTPKAWGGLAARGVIALRDQLGRAPTGGERRALWDALWRAVWASGPSPLPPSSRPGDSSRASR